MCSQPDAFQKADSWLFEGATLFTSYSGSPVSVVVQTPSSRATPSQPLAHTHLPDRDVGAVHGRYRRLVHYFKVRS